MGIEMQPVMRNGDLMLSLWNQRVHPGDKVTFAFQNAVVDYVLGIWAFRVAYPNQDHGVQSVSLRLSPESLVGSKLTVAVDANLTYGQGPDVDKDNSYIVPVCLAITGSSDDTDDTYMASYANPISNGSSSSPVKLPATDTSYNPATSCLSGFELSYPGVENMNGMSAGCGFAPAPTGEAYVISGTATMFDSVGHTAEIANIYAGYIASSASSPGFQVVPIGPVQKWQDFNVTMDQLKSVSQVGVMIQNWNVRYDPHYDHNVWGVSASFLWDAPGQNVTITGKKVALPGLSAQMWDGGDHNQNDDLSNLSALIIGLP